MIISFLSIFLFLTPLSIDQSIQQPATSMIDHEELVYDISWAHIKLATLQMHFVHRTEGASHSIVRTTIDSGSKLHLVNVHLVACSEMDSMGNSIVYYSYEKKDNTWETMLYEYHPELHCILMTKGIQDNSEQRPSPAMKPDTLSARSFPVQDGISIIYFLRTFIRQNDTASLPTVSMGKVGETEIYKERKRTTIEIDSCNYPIRVVKFSGKMRLDGISGLNGNFDAWFSDDEASIPIVGTMKVLIGSIRIELKQWNHGTWRPPSGH